VDSPVVSGKLDVALDGRGPSLGPSSSPTTRSMEKRIQEDWDSATDDRETFLYMFKEDRKK